MSPLIAAITLRLLITKFETSIIPEKKRNSKKSSVKKFAPDEILYHKVASHKIFGQKNHAVETAE